METFQIETLGELEAAARAVLSSLRARGEDRAIVGLTGDLGAGKTTFVQALARLLGVREQVTSPTFTIMKRYETNDGTFAYLVHIDAYRIESVDEMEILGFADLLNEKSTIICIEWPERIGSLIPDEAWTLTFSVDEHGRRTLACRA